MLENATYTSEVGVIDAANVTTHTVYTDVNTPANTAVNTPVHTAAINSTVDGVVSHLLPVRRCGPNTRKNTIRKMLT